MPTVKKVMKNGTIQWKATKPVTQEWSRTFKNKEDAKKWVKK